MRSHLSCCLALTMCLISARSHAQDCNAILQHGFKNIAIAKSEDARSATKYFSNCGKNMSSMSDDVLASLEVSVFGYGSGSAGFSRKQREDKLNEWCQINKEFSEQHTKDYQEAQDIYAPSVAAWDSCNKLAANSVQIIPVITPDDQTVDLKIKYSGPASGVQLQKIVHSGFTCTITQSSSRTNVTPPIELGRSLVNVNCERNAAHEVVRGTTHFSSFDRGTISVHTGGEILQLYFPPKWDPELPDSEAARIRADIEVLKRSVAPGTVVAYAGKIAPNGWLLCDGSPVPRMGKYAALFASIRDSYGKGDGIDTFNVPNYAGQFLRGFDPKHQVDTDAQRTLGSPQSANVGEHSHGNLVVELVLADRTAKQDAYFFPSNQRIDGQVFWGHMVGQNPLTGEPRPTNIAVNWIIKY